MRKKMVLFLTILAVIFTYARAFAEETKLISYYPAPYGAYKELINTGNMWIGKDTNGKPFKGGKGLLQVGGTTTESCSIYGKITSLDSIGIIGESDTKCGVKGIVNTLSGDSTDHYGVFGQAKSQADDQANIYGLYGKAKGDIANSINTTAYGVYGEGEDYGGYFLSDNNYAVYGESSNNWGGWFEGEFGVKVKSATTGVHVESETGYGVWVKTTKGTAINSECGSSDAGEYAGYFTGGEYAGYFNGNVCVKGRADPDILNIPVLNDDPDPAGSIQGDIYYNYISGKLRIFYGGVWKEL